jgi:electron transfer flavoprotein alpha subunit
MTNILAFCYASDKELSRAALEALAATHHLKEQLGGKVQALLIGPDVTAHGETLVQCGADEVFVASHSRLLPHETDVLLSVVEMAVQQLSPGVFILPHDELGSELGARLAYRLKAGIVTDCVGFEIKESIIHWLRPVYGGKAMAYMTAGGPVQVATMRSRAFEPLPADTACQGSIQSLAIDVTATPSPISLLEKVQEELEGISLDVAEIIVSGGRGMEGQEGFAVLKDLAQVLGAATAGSRPAADLGWVPHSNLVGQTGKIVAPNLYIAVAISGAPQHMAGAGSSKTIVAINKDEDAPIFKVAHIGVVDEWQNVISPLTKACRKILSA